MNRTVTIDTVDHGTVILPEPAWCTGHGWQPNPSLADVTHYSVPIKASAMTEAHGLVELLVARISHAPYAVLQPEPHPVIAAALDVDGSFTPDDMAKIAQGLRAAAMRLDRLIGEALRLRGDR